MSDGTLFDTGPPAAGEAQPPAVVAWTEAVRFTVPGHPEQRGSKHGLVQKRWKGEKSIVFRGSVSCERVDGEWRVYGDPMVLMTDDNRDSKRYMDRLRVQARKLWGRRELLDCPIALAADFYFERPKNQYGTGKNAALLKPSAPAFHAQSPDLAKLLRCVEDALTDAIWTDDKLVCMYREPARHWVADGSERTEVVIYVPAGTQLEKF
jgi:Holliday junction resolvase RusA-like endonuclease